jgi:ferredoxin-type protein NapH
MKRRLTQILFLILLNLPLIVIWELKAVCVPVLNCHSCPWALFACPIGVLSHFAWYGTVPLLALGTIGTFGVIFGRFLCGWICPFGWLQDMLYKIPSPKWKLPRWMKWTKYVILVVCVAVVPMTIGLDTLAFFCQLCPAGTLESMIPRNLQAGNYALFAGSWDRFIALIAFLVFAIITLRSFCKVFCPIGAILGIFNRFSAFSLRYQQGDCPSCKLCLTKCPMDVEIEDMRNGGKDEVVTAPAECILCLNCTNSCHQNGIRFSFWNLLPLRKKKKADIKPE